MLHIPWGGLCSCRLSNDEAKQARRDADALPVGIEATASPERLGYCTQGAGVKGAQLNIDLRFSEHSENV